MLLRAGGRGFGGGSRLRGPFGSGYRYRSQWVDEGDDGRVLEGGTRKGQEGAGCAWVARLSSDWQIGFILLSLLVLFE